MATKATIKTYFETGDVPTESQYVETFDSIYFIADGLGTKATFGASATIVIPAERKLVDINFWSTVAQNVKVGDSAGTGEYLDVELVANTVYTLDLGMFVTANKTLHLTGENLATINYKFYIQ
jgi:hypothetical protein